MVALATTAAETMGIVIVSSAVAAYTFSHTWKSTVAIKAKFVYLFNKCTCVCVAFEAMVM